MSKWIGFRTLKTGIGATIAIIFAQLLGLEYASSAGIITILSIQNTKKESLNIALKRLIATIIALVLSSLLFKVLGFNSIVFGIYIILFIPLAVRLKVLEGIVPASVLVTHVLAANRLSSSLFINELLLLLIGAGIALILNLYMPNLEQQLLEDKGYIEQTLYDLMKDMAKALETQQVDRRCGEWLDGLEERLKEARFRARQNNNNHFTQTINHYEKYFEMRERQFQLVIYMRRHFEKFYKTFEQTKKVAEFTEHVALSIYRKITVEALQKELEDLRIFFKENPLPITREEFENRAMLFQFLNDIEQFLNIKKEFKEKLTLEEKKVL
ncbi:hypothetical protein CS063_05875 [Sporanaerobium hydrogeniformans]|uniref:Uncharacterized protein n=1 Tax=Sporanaerobium hydrogeniformans TaxID=3072179 RepID=A0AC61DD31_9FIRM|nr:aromatic acid exporter family protein [Sporanaerobium hydrogeniformans]PHV71219.1 hypothetical protein CS063_05875 [Sporanaerobium hydrogeniformans]